MFTIHKGGVTKGSVPLRHTESHKLAETRVKHSQPLHLFCMLKRVSAIKSQTVGFDLEKLHSLSSSLFFLTIIFKKKVLRLILKHFSLRDTFSQFRVKTGRNV